MLAKKNTSDAIYKTHFEGFEVKPSDTVWYSLAQRLDELEREKKRKKKQAFFITTSLLFASLMVSIWIYALANSPISTISYAKSSHLPQIKQIPKHSFLTDKENLWQVTEKQYNVCLPISALNPGLNHSQIIKEETPTNGKTDLNSGSNQKQTSLQSLMHLTDAGPENPSLNFKENSVATSDTHRKTSSEISPILKDSIQIDNTANKDVVLNISTHTLQTNLTPTNSLTKPSYDTTKKWMLGLFVAPNYSSSYSNTEHETKKIGVSYGLMLGYAIKKNLTLHFGINHTIKNFENSYRFYRIDSSLSQNPGPSGSHINYEYFRTDSTYQLKVQQVEMPLFARYYIRQTNWKVYVSGGISINYLLDATYRYTKFKRHYTNSKEISAQQQTQNVNANGTFRSIHCSFISGIGLQYKVSKNVLIGIEPNWQYALNNVSNTSGKRPYTLSCAFGFNYFFQ
jgi:opacity protein-like surface antigen